jgi:hypothetical protein
VLWRYVVTAIKLSIAMVNQGASVSGAGLACWSWFKSSLTHHPLIAKNNAVCYGIRIGVFKRNYFIAALSIS